MQFGAFMKDIHLFDLNAFGISKSEGVSMDPQHRLLLELSYEAFSRANFNELDSNNTGIFVGISWTEYSKLLNDSGMKTNAYTAQCAVLSVCPGRVSYHFALKGPAVAIDTACSSSLVSISSARDYMSKCIGYSSLVGGINMILLPQTTYMFTKANMLSADGRCKALDHLADGYVRAEAALVFALTNSKDFAKDDLNVVLSGAAVNQDGRSSSLTAPNGPSQQHVIQAAIQSAQISPDQISSIQLHGTGTSLGDPIEVGAASASLRNNRLYKCSDLNILTFQASKSSVGHSEPASGAMGILFLSQYLTNNFQQPVLHLKSLNSHITQNITTSNGICIMKEASPKGKMFSYDYSGISSFAFQGTNAHALLRRPENLNTCDQRPFKACWSRSYHWLAPLPHPMLHFTSLDDSGRVHMDCLLTTTPSLAYIWDHNVCDRVLFPGTGFMELGAASLRMVLGSTEGVISNAIIPFPLVLPGLSDRLKSVVIIRCSFGDALDRRKLVVSSSESGFSQPHLVSFGGKKIGTFSMMERSRLLPNLFSGILLSSKHLGHDRSNSSLVSYIENKGCEQETEQFNAASLDSCLQLAAAASKPEYADISLKVPAGAGALLAGDAEGDVPIGSALWASCLGPMSGSSDLSGAIVMDFSMGSSLSLLGLIAKPLTPIGESREAAETGVTPEDIVYEVAWLVARPNHDTFWNANVSEQLGTFDLSERGAQPQVASSALVAVIQSSNMALLKGMQLSTRGGIYGPVPAAGIAPREREAIASSALQGVVKSAATEMTSVRFGHWDLDTFCSSMSTKIELFSELSAVSSPQAPGGAADHSGLSHTAVLLPSSSPCMVASSFHVVPRPRGAFRNLQLAPVSQRPPSQDEVILSVRAVGVNFRDVLNVLGMYPGDPGPPGGDCSGIISFVGRGVSHIQVGDVVFGFAAGSLGSQVRCLASGLICMPPSMSFESAATVPTVFVTVDSALDSAAGIRIGERVLVHAAAGGVGLAALQAIHDAGAVAVATAGSPFKRGVLRSQGVETALNSRDISFSTEVVMRGGVDVVLNSLTSPGFVAASLSCLRQGGRFVEISKRGIWSSSRVAQERPDLEYFLVATDFLSSKAMHRSLSRLGVRLSSGAVRPLVLAAHSLGNVVAALREMSQARHIGKIVVRTSIALEDRLSSEAGKVLVTGGLGAIGTTVMAWISRTYRGMSLVGVGRSGRFRHVESDPISEIIFNGSDRMISYLTADAASIEGAHLLFQSGGITGVLHASGVLSDATLRNQSAAKFFEVFGPKTAVVQQLKKCGAEWSPSLFEAHFSSVASLLGSPGQANYAAANAALDAMASLAAQKGSQSMSIQWGAWSGSGMAAVDPSTRSRVEKTGLCLVSASSGMSVLFGLLSSSIAKAVAPVHAAVPFSWQRFLSWQSKTFGPESKVPEFYDEFLLESKAVSVEFEHVPGGAPSASPVGSASVHMAVQEAVVAVVGHEVGDDEPLMAAGVDSLGAVELSSSLSQSLGAQLPGTLVFDYPTASALTTFLVESFVGSGFSVNGTSREMLTHETCLASSRTDLNNSLSIGISELSSRSSGDAVLSLFPRDQSERVPLTGWDVEGQVKLSGGSIPVQFGVFLRRVASFDPNAFAVSEIEASSIDPQQRLLLETTAETLLSRAEDLQDKILLSRWGVFVVSKDYFFCECDNNEGPKKVRFGSVYHVFI